MVNAVIFVISVILSITVKASSLQCYVCYDCAAIKEEYLQSCDSISPNSTTTTPWTTSSTTSSTETPSSNTTTTTTEATTSSYTSTTNSTTTTSSVTTEASRIDTAEDTYECFQGKVHVNNSDVIVRGCAVGRTNETCATFGLTSCSFCSSDKCNAAGSMQSSAMVLAVLFLTVVLKE